MHAIAQAMLGICEDEADAYWLAYKFLLANNLLQPLSEPMACLVCVCVKALCFSALVRLLGLSSARVQRSVCQYSSRERCVPLADQQSAAAPVRAHGASGVRVCACAVLLSGACVQPTVCQCSPHEERLHQPFGDSGKAAIRSSAVMKTCLLYTSDAADD